MSLKFSCKIIEAHEYACVTKKTKANTMGRKGKLVERFLDIPTDFTWDELVKILNYFGYFELKKGKTGGSRRKFCNANLHIISLHKPHPSNIVKEYALRQVRDHLEAKGEIKNE